jgi:2-C-methyl-D-erythritol 4-phosphate cytidylyltransferase
VPGEDQNIKITDPLDLIIAEKIMHERKDQEAT